MAELDFFFDLPLASQRGLLELQLPGIWTAPVPERESRLRRFLEQYDLEPYREKIARGLLEATRIESMIPEFYAAFRPVVRDGISFFLARFSAGRLQELVLRQFVLPAEAEPGRRLTALVSRIPVLFKLGQMVARNPHFAQEDRAWLTSLEDRVPTDEPDYDDPAPIGFDPPAADENFALQYSGVLLGAASVGRTVEARWKTGADSPWNRAVVKTLRPHVRDCLSEELAILTDLGEHLEANRSRYEVREFPFRSVFAEIRETLAREIDFPREQANLRAAHEQYAGCRGVQIPVVLPPSNAVRTVMTRMSGQSMQRLGLSASQRRHLARRVFHGFVLFPLLGQADRAIFHGDPHAGNFLIDVSGSTPVLSLLDWSQAGYLNRRQRQALWQMALGLAGREPTRIFRQLMRLTESPARLKEQIIAVHDFIDRQDRQDRQDRRDRQATELADHLLGKACALIDELSSLGITFPFELLLFRKALFTVEGVVRELDPDFAFDRETAQVVGEQAVGEIPGRCWRGFFPLFDRPDVYSAPLTNRDVHCLAQDLVLRGGTRWLASLQG